MYMTVRQMQADLSRMEDALGLLGFVLGKLNEDHGGAFRASMNIGGDPTAIAISAQWETLGAYLSTRESMMGDSDLQSAVRMGSDLFTGAADSISQIRKEAGEPGGIAVVNMARMHMPRVADAIPFALEVCEIAENITGKPLALATAVTGDRSQVAWFGFGDDIDEFAGDQAKLESSEDYVGLFKRSEDLFVPGSLEQSLWQFIL